MFDNDLILIQLLKQTQSQLPHESTKNFEKNEWFSARICFSFRILRQSEALIRIASGRNK